MIRTRLAQYRSLMALAMLTVAGLLFGLVNHTRVASAVDIDSPVITTDRRDLAVCVAGADPVVQKKAVAAVEAAVADLRSNDAPFRNAFAGFADRVVPNCPGPAHLLKPGIGHPLIDGAHTKSNRIIKASPFRLHVYVVSDDQVSRIFKDAPLRVGGQEWLCDGDGCAEVTSALYLTAADLGNPDFIKDGVAKGVGARLLFPLDGPSDHERKLDAGTP